MEAANCAKCTGMRILIFTTCNESCTAALRISEPGGIAWIEGGGTTNASPALHSPYIRM